MKRPRPIDLHVEQTTPSATDCYDYTSYIPAVLMNMWRGWMPQEIVPVQTTPPTSFGNAPKRRAVAREDIQTMPGHFPTSSEPPEERSTRPWPTTPSPSPPRPGDTTTQRRAQTNATTGWLSWFASPFIKSNQTVVAPAHERVEQRRIEQHRTIASVAAPPVPAKDETIDPTRFAEPRRKYMSINERLARLREQEESGQKAPAHLRESYAATAPHRASTQQNPLSPRTDIKNRQSFGRSQYNGLRASTNVDRDSDVDGLLERLKRVTHESAEEASLRESWRLRERRLAGEKGPTGRAQQRKEKERKALEEERLREEQKAQEELQARQEEEQRAREEQEAIEAAQAAEEARKNLLIRPLEPKWASIVNDAMSTTNAQKVFSKGPDGSDITRYILGRILPQKDEGDVHASINGKKGPSSWLNDECVDIWIAFIVARRLEQEGYVKGPNNIPSIASYLSAFWKTYNERGAKALSGWSRRKGISGKKLLGVEKVLFPINAGNHWILLVIAPKSRTIEVFDSLGGQTSRSFKFARDWLAMELGDDYNPDEWQQCPNESSQQQNCDDCGVFACANALASAKNKPPSAVVASNGMHDARNMMVAVLINGGFKEDWEL